MDVLSGSPSSALNPDAPPFVPLAYRAVEDFSDQWWELVKTTSWFRDYWLRECFVEEAETNRGLHVVGYEEEEEAFLPEIGEIFDGYQQRKDGGDWIALFLDLSFLFFFSLFIFS